MFVLPMLRKTIEGYLDSVPSLIFNTTKTKLIIFFYHLFFLLFSHNVQRSIQTQLLYITLVRKAFTCLNNHF